MTNYKISLKNQKVTLKDALIQDPAFELQEKGFDIFKTTGYLIGGCIIVCIGALFAKGCEREPMPTVIKSSGAACNSCHNKLVNYFRVKGSKTPEEMANAVLQTRNPRLLAAVSVIESNGNHKVKNTGFRKQHHGAFQVSSKYWGKVSTNPVQQALQAEKILEELSENRPIKQALNYYGGEANLKTGKYADAVLRELSEVPR